MSWTKMKFASSDVCYNSNFTQVEQRLKFTSSDVCYNSNFTQVPTGLFEKNHSLQKCLHDLDDGEGREQNNVISL